MLFLLYGQTSEQAKNQKGAKSSWGDPAGIHTRFPCVTYFFMSSLVKYGKYECFGLR